MNKHRGMLCLVLSTAVPAAVAQAQTPPEATAAATPSGAAQRSFGDGDIIVTARRVEERLQDVPLSVSAISGESLRGQAVREIKDLSGSVPNLIVQQTNSDPQNLLITIRGQGAANNLLTTDNSVGLYVDGVNVPRTYGLNNGLVDMQRVEVLRGPQGTLYGRNTTGGAVSFITKDPGSELGAVVWGQFGNYDAWGLGSILNLPLSEGAGIRLVAQRAKHSGYGRAVFPDRGLLEQDATYLRAKLKLEAGDLTATATVDYQQDDAGGSIPKLVGLVPATATQPEGGSLTREVAAQLNIPLDQALAYIRSFTNRPPFYTSYGFVGGFSPPISKSKTWSGALNLSWNLADNLTARSISGFRHVEFRSERDVDGLPLVVLDSDQDLKSDNFYSQELQLLGTASAFKWVVGAFYSHERGNNLERSSTLPSASAGNVTVYDSRVISSSFAVFGQVDWQITDRLGFTGGLRWTKERKGVDNRNFTTRNGCAIPVALRDQPGVCLVTPRNSYDDPSWLASLDYRVADDVMLYGKVSRGFRGGGQNQRAVNSPAAFQPFGPETVTEYEAGLKSQFLDRRLTVNLAAYYQDYTDVQRTVSVVLGGSTASIITTAAAASLKGAEAELSFRATEALTFNATVGHMKAKYKEFRDLTGDRSGEDWPAPDWTYSLGVNLNVPVAPGLLSANLRFNGQSALNLAPVGKLRDQLTQDGYGLLSGRLALNITDWNTEVSVFGRNLTAKKYYSAANAVEALGFNQLLAGNPRTFGLEVRKFLGGEAK